MEFYYKNSSKHKLSLSIFESKLEFGIFKKYAFKMWKKQSHYHACQVIILFHVLVSTLLKMLNKKCKQDD